MNILLCCNGGFSTSLVVSKMQEAATKLGENHTIWAVNVDAVSEHIANVDVILLGPHMKFMLEPVEEIASKYHVPVGIIAQQDYGRCNGENVLTLAKSLKAGKES